MTFHKNEPIIHTMSFFCLEILDQQNLVGKTFLSTRFFGQDPYLGGGLNNFLFSPLNLGKSPILTNIFQRG